MMHGKFQTLGLISNYPIFSFWNLKSIIPERKLTFEEQKCLCKCVMQGLPYYVQYLQREQLKNTFEIYMANDLGDIFFSILP